MGKVARGLLIRMVANAIQEVGADSMENSKVLGGLARALVEEEEYEIVNLPKLVEAAARCIDAVELMVEACVPANGADSIWEEIEMRMEYDEIRTKLAQVKQEILNLLKEATD